MTDEQKLAERYVNRIPIFADEGEGFSRTQMQQSFLDGLEAGRPKWHKVADGDLPNENKRYLCKIKEFVGSGINYECFDYDTEYSSWKNACGDVIEWCEIQKCTEE